jgi:dihydrolipoamide dehydrogenase
MQPEPGGIRVTLEGEGAGERPADQTFDRVLVSVGRRPNSAIPGLDRTRVEVNERGFIVVDQQMRTAEPSLFAIGDVVGEPMLAHKASHEGRTAVEVIAGENVAFAPRAIPAVVFTDPELAWAGLTEGQARRDGREVAIVKFPWGASGRALTLDRTDGLTKLVLDPATERLLGVGLVGPGAGELIAEGVLAIEMGANATDLKLSIHPHPTLTETLMESAEVFFGQATHVYRPRR